MKIIAKDGNREIAYIQKRDVAYIRQMYFGKVDYSERNGEFVKITDSKIIEKLKDMEYILDYEDLIEYDGKQLTRIYNSLKDAYNKEHKHHIDGIISLDEMEDLSEIQEKAMERSTYDIASDQIFYMLEQLREFCMMLSGKIRIKLPMILSRNTFNMQINDNYEIIGTFNPNVLALIHRNHLKIDPKEVPANAVQTAIWLNHANHKTAQTVINTEELNTDYTWENNGKILLIKTEKNNIKNDNYNNIWIFPWSNQFSLYEMVEKAKENAKGIQKSKNL